MRCRVALLPMTVRFQKGSDCCFIWQLRKEQNAWPQYLLHQLFRSCRFQKRRVLFMKSTQTAHPAQSGCCRKPLVHSHRCCTPEAAAAIVSLITIRHTAVTAADAVHKHQRRSICCDMACSYLLLFLMFTVYPGNIIWKHVICIQKPLKVLTKNHAWCHNTTEGKALVFCGRGRSARVKTCFAVVLKICQIIS